MTDFESSVALSLEVEQRELRRVRGDIENALADIPVGVERPGEMRADGGAGGGGRERSRRRREHRWARQRTNDIEDIVELLEGLDSEEGGGLLDSLLGGAGGLAGILPQALATGVGASIGSVIGDVVTDDDIQLDIDEEEGGPLAPFENFARNLQDNIAIEDSNGNVMVEVEDPSPLDVDAPDHISVDYPEDIPLDYPDYVPLQYPESIPLDDDLLPLGINDDLLPLPVEDVKVGVDVNVGVDGSQAPRDRASDVDEIDPPVGLREHIVEFVGGRTGRMLDEWIEEQAKEVSPFVDQNGSRTTPSEQELSVRRSATTDTSATTVEVAVRPDVRIDVSDIQRMGDELRDEMDAMIDDLEHRLEREISNQIDDVITR